MKNCKGYEKYEQGYQSEFILSTLIISSFELSVAYFSVGDIFSLPLVFFRQFTTRRDATGSCRCEWPAAVWVHASVCVCVGWLMRLIHVIGIKLNACPTTPHLAAGVKKMNDQPQSGIRPAVHLALLLFAAGYF